MNYIWFLSSIVLILYFCRQLMKTRRRLELLLEDLPCDYDTEEYCETSDQLLEPLLLCYESLVSPLEQLWLNNAGLVIC
jgi:hypothetical protein